MEEENHQGLPPSQPRDRRPDALGDMRLLPDEILCNIIDRLDAPDIARLACVSSVMYIFCNEEPLWMNRCLKDGGQLEYKGCWKTTFLSRKKLSIADTFKRNLQFDGFSSLFLYKRWYRCFTTLDSFSLDYGGLQRKKNLSLEEFYSEYDGQKPVLLTDLSNDWPARKTWTILQLLQDYGDISFRISQRSSKKLTMQFKHYVSYLEIQHDEDPLYIFDDKFGEAAPGLLKDYEVPLLFQEDLFDVLDHDQRPPFRWLIIGPERSGASWHVDPALTSAWNTLLLGRKRWAFYPPGRVPAGVTVHVNEEDGDVDIETPSSLQWWLDIYPLLADEDKPIECTQLPGETIFVPSGWWHCVLNLETTIAVTQNFVNGSNFEFVCLDMAPGHLHKGVCRAGLLAAQDLKEFDFHINQYNYADMTRKEKRSRKRTVLESGGHTNVKQRLRNVDVLQSEEFCYDIDFLSIFLDKKKDHYSSIWSPSNCMGQREMRAWLHKLWVTKPDFRELTWKGASIALNIDKWTACMLEICGFHGLKSPLEEEKFPVGTGSNPVYLVSDYVIKIFVEGGLEASLYSLGTEFEFYNILQKANSHLIDHVPKILASGIITCENGIFTTKTWNEVGDLDVIPRETFACTQRDDVSFHLGIWSKMQFECIKTKAVTSTTIWPYLVTERCKGEILANLRGELSKDDGLNLASFLGCQLRNLHLLPVPIMQNNDLQVGLKMDLRRRSIKCLGVDTKFVELPDTEKVSQTFIIPLECELFTTAIDRRRRDLVDRLIHWGDPIPRFLIEKVEEYIPTDIALFLNFFKDMNDTYKFCGSLAWIHSDVMDDNIHMAVYSSENCSDKAIPDSSSEVNNMVNGGSKGLPKTWRATHILDFSDLSIGDPLCDIIPLYLDVLRGDSSLLSQVLASYRLPLSIKLPDGLEESWKKFRRLSYRAMCYCILHEDNVLGAIFGLWEELRLANSWEEVEEAVWGELNRYVPIDDH